MKVFNVAVCIPTFNRKELLVKCLDAVSSQTLTPKCIYIIDNHSSDGTPEFLKEKGYDQSINGVEVDYFYSEINGGGALGFSLAMEKAYKKGIYDAFWMLDDDGLPAHDCLEKLSRYVDQYGYVSPVLMDINDKDLLNVPCNGSRNPEALKKMYGGHDVMKGYCNPFNGGLFSKKAVARVGFPKRELFIYGDEMNYHQRMVEAGFIPYGIFQARHMHPVVRVDNLKRFARCVTFRDVEWSFYCACRNSVYNKKIRKDFVGKKILKIVYYILAHYVFFLFIHPSLKYIGLFTNAVHDGLCEKWGKQYKYLKK